MAGKDTFVRWPHRQASNDCKYNDYTQLHGKGSRSAGAVCKYQLPSPAILITEHSLLPMNDECQLAVSRVHITMEIFKIWI
jgi:hypothetical protein